MGVIYDYFVAPSDATAAATIDDGPQGGYTTAEEAGIDPAVMLGTLEELLTGRSFDDILEDPRSAHVVADRDDGECSVFTVTDALIDALASATREQLAAVLPRWAASEEAEDFELEILGERLEELAELAKEARASNGSVYCWFSL